MTATRASVVVNGTPLDRYDIVAVNDGVGTGTEVKGLEYVWTGSRVFFQLDDLTDATGVGDADHIPDTVRFSSSTLTRLRVNTVAGNSVVVGESPYRGPTQWNPYMVGLKQFLGAIANIGTTQATGTGFQIARLFMLQGGGGSFSGNIGGDVGAKVPFFMYGGPIYSGPPIDYGLSTDLDEPVVASFGADVSAGAPFSVRIAVTRPNPILPPTTLSTTPIPGVNDVTVTSTINGAVQEFTVTGRVDYSRLYNPTIVPFAIGGSGLPADSFTLFAVPEPTLLGLVGLVAGVARRERRG